MLSSFLLGGLLPPEFCFPTSLQFHAGSFLWVSVIHSYVVSSEDEDLKSYVLGWGLLAENLTKVALSGELFYFADLPTGYWPGRWCFVFYNLGP